MKCDFQGWASKNNLRCADGRIIRNGAFDDNDGKTVPLVFGHQHNSIDDVLGHAILEKRDDGVWAYGFFNDTPNGIKSKEAVMHGDITALSIWANQLQQVGSDVMHGIIREVSLVLAGANPGAFIESTLSHGEPMEDGDDEGIFYTDENLFFENSLEHSDDKKDDDEKEDEEENDDEDSDDSSKDEKTIAEVLKTMNPEQLSAVGSLIDQVVDQTVEQMSESKDDDNKEENEDGSKEPSNKEETEMKHNIFESQSAAPSASAEDVKAFLANAKRVGSLKEAIRLEIENDGVLAHALDTTGMDTPEADPSKTYGINGIEYLFPEFKNLTKEPEFIGRDMDWVKGVMTSVHRTPFSRIKSTFADITEDEARAKGYMKGNLKKEEVFSLLKRTTDPQTVYKKQKIDKDDIDDITDFDVVSWIRKEMRVMLDEEIARAILIGDGRSSVAEDKIQESHIRPIATDVALFNVQTPVEVSSTATSAEKADALEDAILKSRKNYKGSGHPNFYTTEDVVTDMLLRKDKNGRRIYKTVEELAAALRVDNIITVEPMEGQTVTFGEKTSLPLLGIMCNLKDYNVGADKGGEINSFADFDIDYNQNKYLIETRISGALIKPYSAITFALDEQTKA